ncbi:bifunctional diaminohydroxyphosphoribosylaminopyrimidine deaminase/5-amino-6-(5-phosphoribosylamino)uracil reductase RibD [Nocardioides sp.]|uniref:bifunctional diaminohydroxyphosphoribosylaminopyrimidine deaminase/5-amino-6-(5-phosphoribosylamino)uracil reductase RibD n=1 Tax=Nocardioides sp. TaxID=35761 RepID=UPI00273707E2|nr:bifunctional diaminohydroxyphosphoribosylaminopyrimidine deaminase/5-amino-6-(5-phosphoribosylamino)uracil reductase RibD [Nocardioides sp.]MDP3892745.1 bifunctional diaminohydroxyphosphoribosylaminopyrimidine deaminase/5-amino-6-(5-phosphoribosylamino)uracil reductase RibD [Nocardioides sp.]
MQRDAQVEKTAMRHALDAGTTPGLPFGPNPRVGCAVLDADGRLVAVGHHRGAGTPHAEVDALTRAGERAHGGTALVTLEPCTHTGRTGPCADALLAAGVRRVVVGMRDPNPVAAGGVDVLRAAGVEVDVLDAHLPLARAIHAANRGWAHGLSHERPFVTWKTAGTLDGRAAAADGSSRWITGEPARAEVHALRARVDTVLVGTGTVLADDPALTVRSADGTAAPTQPLRAVMGERPVPAEARLLTDGAAETVHLTTRDPRTALATLFERGRREVLLEGGATLAAAFLAAGLVDEVVAYVAPALLGAGFPVLGDLGITTIDDALRLRLTDVARVGDDVRLVLHPSPTAPPEE